MFKLRKSVLIALTPLILLSLLPIMVIAASQTFTVPAGSAIDKYFDLSNGDRFSGSISVSGGSGNDINFYVTDPSGERIVNAVRITQTSFSFTASTSGTYVMSFDNTFSIISSKSVTWDYSIAIGILGIPQNYFFILLGIIIIVILVVALVLIVKRRKPKSSQVAPQAKTS